MATIAELEARISELRARLASVAQSAKDALEVLRALSEEARALSRAGQDAAAQAKSAEAQQYKIQVYRPLDSQETELQQEIARLETQLQQLRVQREETAAPGTASAGAIAAQSSTARDDAANSVIPNSSTGLVLDAKGRVVPGPVPGTVVPSNAEVSPALDTQDLGTNSPVRTLANTQSVGPGGADGQANATSGGFLETGAAARNAAAGVQTPGTNTGFYPGAAAPNDDGVSDSVSDTTGAANATQAAINRRFGGTVQSRPNILDQYSSYTYSISIYLMGPEEYRRMLETKTKLLSGSQLLVQSGGISGGTETVRTPQTTASGAIVGGETLTRSGRNQFFPLDYYIDSLRLKSYINGKGTRGAHNVTEMEFRICEPNGVTLFENLYRAVQNFVTNRSGTQVPQNYAAQHYLMVIRFYGYDSAGNLQTPPALDSSGRTDQNAIVEKFIPFRFTGIKFRIANKLTEYNCTAVCPQNDIATGQARGVIPYNVEFTATTLKNLMIGAAEFVAPTQAPPDAGSAPRPNLINGLTEALNRYQQELVDRGIIAVKDEYSIQLVEPELQNAKIRPPGKLDKGTTGAAPVNTPRQALDGSTQAVDTSSRGFGAVAGMPIVQFIDLAVRNSTYVYDQQTKIIDPETGATTSQGGAQTPAWYRIGVQVEPLEYDNIRKDYAYRITYQVSMYKVSLIKSDYFPEGRFVGAQKRYAYWFTGENTAVLRFEQDFNYLFYITVNTYQPTNPQTGAFTSDYREYEKRAFSPRSPQSSQGNPGNVNEPGANAADYLYSPGDQGEVRLEIVGDPAWIQQGELWSGTAGIGVTDPASVAFLPDGTINFESQEALFEIAFNKPADYDLATGLMDIPRRQ